MATRRESKRPGGLRAVNWPLRDYPLYAIVTLSPLLSGGCRGRLAESERAHGRVIRIGTGIQHVAIVGTHDHRIWTSWNHALLPAYSP